MKKPKLVTMKKFIMFSLIASAIIMSYGYASADNYLVVKTNGGKVIYMKSYKVNGITDIDIQYLKNPTTFELVNRGIPREAWETCVSRSADIYSSKVKELEIKNQVLMLENKYQKSNLNQQLVKKDKKINILSWSLAFAILLLIVVAVISRITQENALYDAQKAIDHANNPRYQNSKKT